MDSKNLELELEKSRVFSSLNRVSHSPIHPLEILLDSHYFFLWYRMFWPPMRTLPLGHPWIRGFIPYLVAVETVNCFTRQSAMESSVVSSLPDHAFTPTLESTGWNDQLWNTLPRVSHIVDCSPSALLPSGELDTDEMRQSHGRTFLWDADPHKSFGENLLVYHPWKVEQPWRPLHYRNDPGCEPR